MRRSTLQLVRLCARFSRWLPAAIVACAEEARRTHVAFGYDPENMIVIPNGFDTEALRPDPAARDSVRAELGLPPETALVGLVARFHPQKDHQSFARAAEHLRWRWQRDDVHFVLCGRGVTGDNPELIDWLDKAKVRDRCHLLGDRRDVARIQAALDLACLSSAGGEAFPLVLGEAMACGIPCVATDVADTRLLVGEAGRIVPPRDPVALASAMAEVLDLPTAERARLGTIARRRIETCYSLPRIVERYAALHAGHTTRMQSEVLPSGAQ
jgi:glycosyltransferase involved in cell wall biosynthesis